MQYSRRDFLRIKGAGGVLMAGGSWLSLLSSCASLGPFKPNTPFVGVLPSSFQYVEKRNPLLATELRKLPEVLSGNGEGLEGVIELYDSMPDTFDRVFARMYGEKSEDAWAVGYPEIRQYCTPLQALYWLVEDGFEDVARFAVEDYCTPRRNLDLKRPDTGLKQLTDFAWYERKGVDNWWDDLNAYAVFESCTDAQLKREIEAFEKQCDRGRQTLHIYHQAKDHPEAFEKSFAPMSRELRARHEARWEDFNVVAARANSPQLFNSYLYKMIEYKADKYSPAKPAYRTFSGKYGDCNDAVVLAQSFLGKNGWSIKMEWPGQRHFIGTTVFLGKERKVVDFGH